MKQRNYKKIILIGLILLTLIFITPIPYYLPKGAYRCLLVEGCPKTGFNFSPSLLQRLLTKLTGEDKSITPDLSPTPFVYDDRPLTPTVVPSLTPVEDLPLL